MQGKRVGRGKSNLSELDRLRSEKPEAFLLLVAETVLGIRAKDAEPRLLLQHGEAAVRVRAQCKFLCSLIRQMLLPSTNLLVEREFSSFSELVEKSFDLEMPRVRCTQIEFEYEQFVYRSLFPYYERQLARLLAALTEKVYQGLPIYALKKGAYSAMPETDETHAYIRLRGMHQDMVETWELPAWTSKCFFRNEDLAVHARIFKAGEELTLAELNERREALRYLLGVPLSGNKHIEMHSWKTSRLMAAVTAVHARFYGSGFDLNDKNTWPSQEKSVIPWLIGEFQFKHREALAVDIVARPDKLRGKVGKHGARVMTVALRAPTGLILSSYSTTWRSRMTTSQSILRMPAVKACTGLGRSTIYGLIKAGAFPQPVPLGARAVGWLRSDIDAWISSRATARASLSIEN